MPVFLIEWTFAEQLESVEDIVPAINQINADFGIQWLISFLSADKKKTYCLYEAPSSELIREAATKAGLPVDAVVAVTELQTSGRMADINLNRFA